MANTSTRKRFSLRGFTSLLLTCSFLVMGFSGAMLYLSPRGRVANWTDWTLLGLSKDQWEAVHISNSVLFLVVAALHLALNWSMFWGYIKKKASAGLNLRRELALAAIIAAAVVVGTLCAVPPMSTVFGWRQDIKDYWERRSAEAPVPHSEESTLAEFARQINLSLEEVTEALRNEGYEVIGDTVTMADLAHRNGVAPSDVFAAIQKHFPSAGSFPGRGAGQGRGPRPRGSQGFGPEGGPGVGPGHGRGYGRGGARGLGQGYGRGFGPTDAESDLSLD